MKSIIAGVLESGDRSGEIKLRSGGSKIPREKQHHLGRKKATRKSGWLA